MSFCQQGASVSTSQLRPSNQSLSAKQWPSGRREAAPTRAAPKSRCRLRRISGSKTKKLSGTCNARTDVQCCIFVLKPNMKQMIKLEF